MDIGVVYPQIELRGDPQAVRQIALATETLGYNHLLAYDHVLGAVHADRQPPLTGPYTERDPFHDPLMMFAYLAGLTAHLKFVSGVLISPQRQTALLARQAADLDLLSGGRFRMGIGVGWNFVEYEALGQDFHTRGAREEEQMILLRKLWTEPIVDFTGRFDRIDRASTLPMPSSPIPIWLGGFGDIALRRAAKLGDGFIFGGSTKVVLAAWNRIKELLEAHGRDVAEFGAESAIASNHGAVAHAERILAWKEAGGTHATVVTMGLGLDSSAAHIDYISQVAAQLGLSAQA